MLCTATWNSIREYAGLALRIHQYPIHRSISFIQCLPDEVQFPLYLCKVQPIKWQQTVRLKDVHTEALEVSRASSGSVGAASREECRASHDCSSFFGDGNVGVPCSKDGPQIKFNPHIQVEFNQIIIHHSIFYSIFDFEQPCLQTQGPVVVFLCVGVECHSYHPVLIHQVAWDNKYHRPFS